MKALIIGFSEQNFQTNLRRVTGQLLFCRNPIEALHILSEENNIEAIICKYNLSGNNGIFFYDELKSNLNYSKMPFILIVDEHQPEIYRRAFKKGIDDYFVIGSIPSDLLFSRAKQLTQIRKYDKGDKSVENSSEYRFPLSKRIFDIAIASVALLILSPLLIFTILAIRLESKGKVYYTAKRVGQRTFNFYKLRSMRTGADKLLQQLAKEKNQYNTIKAEANDNYEQGCPKCKKLPAGKFCSPLKYAENQKVCDYWHTHQNKLVQRQNSSFIKIVDDPRITRIGKFIRNTSIDELPQLVNVIKGDMSLVGNRPLPVYEAELLTKDQLAKRFLAPAGITGLWQVELRGRGGNMSEDERIALDNRYADYFTNNNYSFWFDLVILLRTIPALFQKSSV